MTARFTPPLRILNRDALVAYLATSRRTLHRRIEDGLFPPGFPINGNRLGWLEREAQDAAALLASKATDAATRKWVRNAVAARKRLRKG